MDMHDPRHERMARQIGAWTSWVDGPWWTDRRLILRTARSFTASGRLELDCLCGEDHPAASADAHTVVDVFVPGDPFRNGRAKLLALIDRTDPVSIALAADTEDGDTAGVPHRRATARDGRWWAFQQRYLTAATRYCRPDAYALHDNTMLVARRRSEVVAVIMTLWVSGSSAPKPSPDGRPAARAVGST